jgi:uncharacterized protein with FMN-binding domain
MRKERAILFALIALGFVFAGCPTDPEEDTRHPAYGTPPFTDTVEGQKTGGHAGGTAKVVIKLTLEEGYITAVDLSESTGNTAGYGLPVITDAPAEIIAKNSVEIDKVSGATVTWETLVAAGKAALGQIPGYTPE